MPRPKRGERKQEYIDRFMASEEARRDYPDEKQRYAVAQSMWANRQKKSMKYDLDSILKSLASRTSGTRWGIGTAAGYMGEIGQCLDAAGACPVKLFSLQSSDAWRKSLDEAAGRLTYCDEGMADVGAMVKSINEGTGIADWAILEYDAVLSSSSIDRDNDIVESKGLDLDPNMPALWMHLQMQPLGRVIKILEQNDRWTKGRYGIADTELGRDAAILVKAGALRNSIGFKPSDFEPREIVKAANGENVVKGWHVKKARVMEKSLVSVPANTDAIITAYSRKSLKTPLMSSWAKSYYDRRPTVVPVQLDLQVKVNGQSVGGPTYDESTGRWLDSPRGQKDTVTSGVSAGGMGQGSAATPKGNDAAAGTQQDTGANKPGKGKCTACGGETDATGTCQKCGTIQEAGTGKQLGDLLEKAGRVLSAANLTLVKDAKDALEKLLAAATTDEAMQASTAPTNLKSLQSLETKMHGVEHEMPGSFEWTRDRLRKTAASYLRGKGKELDEHGYGYIDMVATFADRAIVCYYDGKKNSCYAIAWKMGNDSEPVWDGDPKEVTVAPQVIEKTFAHLTLKGLAQQFAAKSIVASDSELDTAQRIIDDATFIHRSSRETAELEELIGV